MREEVLAPVSARYGRLTHLAWWLLCGRSSRIPLILTGFPAIRRIRRCRRVKLSQASIFWRKHHCDGRQSPNPPCLTVGAHCRKVPPIQPHPRESGRLDGAGRVFRDRLPEAVHQFRFEDCRHTRHDSTAFAPRLVSGGGEKHPPGHVRHGRFMVHQASPVQKPPLPSAVNRRVVGSSPT